MAPMSLDNGRRYSDLQGYINFFNEIGHFKGEVLADEQMPAGD
jgi:hypothetical protein